MNYEVIIKSVAEFPNCFSSDDNMNYMKVHPLCSENSATEIQGKLLITSTPSLDKEDLVLCIKRGFMMV